MNFKPLLYNKIWIVYYHYDKNKNGCLGVAVQSRYSGFTGTYYHSSCHLSSWLPSAKDGCRNFSLHGHISYSWKKERYVMTLELVPFKEFLEVPLRPETFACISLTTAIYNRQNFRLPRSLLSPFLHCSILLSFSPFLYCYHL